MIFVQNFESVGIQPEYLDTLSLLCSFCNDANPKNSGLESQGFPFSSESERI